MNDLTIPLADLAKVRAWAESETASRPADFIIGPADNPQVLRWWAIPRNPVSNVYIHRFLRSDDDRALHDHPWNNTSWVLSGEYLEHLADGESATRYTGDVITRTALRPDGTGTPHRVELVTDPVLTLFFTGPIIREWGFHCPTGWKHWKDFVEVYPGGNRTGRGCE